MSAPRRINRRTNKYGDMLMRLVNGRPLTKAQAKLAEDDGLTTPEAIDDAWRELLRVRPFREAIVGADFFGLPVRVEVLAVAPSGAVYVRNKLCGPATAVATLGSVLAERDMKHSRYRIEDPGGLLDAATASRRAA